MGTKKVIVIGGSIAGSSVSLLLKKAGYDVLVIEKKCLNEVGKKLCANVVTKDFFTVARRMGLPFKSIAKTRFKWANFLSENNLIRMRVSEYEIDRAKILKEIIRKAMAEGVKFEFGVSFIDARRKGGRYKVILKKGSKEISNECDILIGADGAVSLVAKRSNLWQRRRFIMFMQATVKKSEIKNFKLREGNYYIFLGEKYGYYAYIFPGRNYATVGIGDCKHDILSKFDGFAKQLGIKKQKAKSALVPIPKPIKIRKGNIFLVGDAASEVKFSGGGIVPALKNALALSRLISSNDSRELKRLRTELFAQFLATKFIMKCRNFDRLVEAVKNKAIVEIIRNRDNSKFSVVKATPAVLRLLHSLF